MASPPAKPVASPPAESLIEVPVSAGEKVLVSAAPRTELPTGPVQISIDEAVPSGRPIDAEVRIASPKVQAITMTIEGRGAAEQQTVTIRPENPSRRVTFRSKPDGTYRIVAKLDGSESSAVVRVISPPLIEAYRFHVETAAGAHRLIKRAVVTTPGGYVHRALWMGPGDAVTLVDVSSESGVLAKHLPPGQAPAVAIGEHAVHVTETAAGYDARWIALSDTQQRLAVRVLGPRLDDRAILEVVLQRLPPDATAAAPAPAPPTPTAPPAAPLYNTAPAGQCSADAEHCCIRNDIQIVKPGGCPQPALTRGADGFCEPLACN